MKTNNPGASAETTKHDGPHTLLEGTKPSSQSGDGLSIRLLVLAVALVVGSTAVLRAQTAEWQLAQSNAIPQVGTFYSIQLSNYPPMPFNPYPQLDVYSVNGAPGEYWVDDRAVDYAAVREQREMERALSRMESQYGLSALEDSPVSLSASIAYPDGSFWLSIARITNGLAPLTLHGTSPEELYEILTQPILTNGGWASEGGILGAANQDWTPITVPVGDRTNSLFFRAIYWSNCDGFATPAAWYWQHGLNPLTPGIATQDPDHDGLLNWQEYLWGGDPQASAGFSVWVSSPGGYSGIP